MDNAIVGVTGLTCYILAETATNWVDSISPLGIVALVVYYFLIKFDKKLDAVEKATNKIEIDVEEIKDKVEHEHNKENCNE